MFKTQIVLSVSVTNYSFSATNLLSAELRVALHSVFMKCRMCNKLVATCIFIVSKLMWSVFRPEKAAVPVYAIAPGDLVKVKWRKLILGCKAEYE